MYGCVAPWARPARTGTRGDAVEHEEEQAPETEDVRAVKEEVGEIVKEEEPDKEEEWAVKEEVGEKAVQRHSRSRLSRRVSQ